MSKERGYEGPPNIVSKNRYISESQRRVDNGLVREQEWYIARVVNPDSGSVDQYAADLLMRTVEVVRMKNGLIKVYLNPVSHDGDENLGEDDATWMNADGYFIIKDGSELGYLLDIFAKRPKDLGALAAEATLFA